MKYEAVIFDLFGTLVDNMPYKEYEDVLSQVASLLAAPSDEFRQLWYETARDRGTGVCKTIPDNIKYICERLGVDVDENMVRLADRTRQHYIASVIRPRQGCIEVLSTLKSRGHKLGLISNCSLETPLIWRDTELAALFDEAVFSCAVGIEKPDRRIYDLTLTRLAVVADSCLYVGDGGSNELSGAAAVGMHPVLIRAPYEDGNQPHLVNREIWTGQAISSLKQVLDVVCSGTE